MTVSATVLVVVHLAPVVPRTTTHSTPDPRWIPQRPTTTTKPLLLSPLLNSNTRQQTLPMVALAKVSVAAMVVWLPSVLSHVPTVGRRRHHFGAVTTLGTIFATLVVSPPSPTICLRVVITVAPMMRWHVLMGRRLKLSYHITTFFFLFFFFDNVFFFETCVSAVCVLWLGVASSMSEIEPNLPYSCRSVLQASWHT